MKYPRIFVTPRMVKAAQAVRYSCGDSGAPCEPLDCYDCMEKLLEAALVAWRKESAEWPELPERS